MMTADSWVSDQFSFEECTLSKHEGSFTGGEQDQEHAFHFLSHHLWTKNLSTTQVLLYQLEVENIQWMLLNGGVCCCYLLTQTVT